MIPFKSGLEDAIRQLSEEKDMPFVAMMHHGSLTVEYYAPVEVDYQTPHKQDEIYVIASGKGILERNGEYQECKAGDVLFVPAGMEHHFERFSSDFATWVIFYGPEGGEKPQ